MRLLTQTTTPRTGGAVSFVLVSLLSPANSSYIWVNSEPYLQKSNQYCEFKHESAASIHKYCLCHCRSWLISSGCLCMCQKGNSQNSWMTKCCECLPCYWLKSIGNPESSLTGAESPKVQLRTESQMNPAPNFLNFQWFLTPSWPVLS